MGTRAAASRVSLSVTSTIQNTLDDGKIASAALGKAIISSAHATGVSGTQANRFWQSEDRVLAGGGSEVIDLFDFAGLDIGGGTALDALGQTLIMEEIVSIAIICNTGPGTLEVTPDATNGWNPIGLHTVATGGGLRAGGVVFKQMADEDAFDVNDGISHRINIGANGGACTYSIYVLGRHDDNESSSSSSSSVSSSSSSSSASSLSSTSSSSASSLSSLSSSSLSSSSTS